MAVAADLHRDFLIPGLCSFNKSRIAALFLTYSLAVGNYVFGRAAPVRLALHHFLNDQLTHSGKQRIAALLIILNSHFAFFICPTTHIRLQACVQMTHVIVRVGQYYTPASPFLSRLLQKFV